MSIGLRNWLYAWCALVFVFGLVLTGAASAATDGPTRVLLTAFNPAARTVLDPTLRFTTALMGAVTLGWGLTMVALVRAADLLGDRAAPVWRLVVLSLIIWFVIDSSLSIATGFALNAVSNAILLAAFALPLWASGSLRARPA